MLICCVKIYHIYQKLNIWSDEFILISSSTPFEWWIKNRLADRIFLEFFFGGHVLLLQGAIIPSLYV